MIFAYCNAAGGVGRSTTVFHHARAAILAGYKVLVIDADPQGNITSVLAPDVEEEEAGLADALSSRSPYQLSDVLVPGTWEGLTVVPTTGDGLTEVRNELTVSNEPGREFKLRDQLESIRADFDVILIDCGSPIDSLTISALTAASAVVIVTRPKLWSINGLAKLMNTINQIRGYYNPSLNVAGIVLNAHEPYTLAGRHWFDELMEVAEMIQFPIIEPSVPKRAAIVDATEMARGLDEGDVQSRELAEIYSAHITQLMERASAPNRSGRLRSVLSDVVAVAPTSGRVGGDTAPKKSAAVSTGQQSERKKLGYYVTAEENDRIRAAFIEARKAGLPYRSLSEFQAATIFEKVEQLEAQRNDGKPFDGAPPHTLTPGRPLE